MEQNDGINRPIFYRRDRLWDRIGNRRTASFICIFVSLIGFGAYHHFDTLRSYEKGIEVGKQQCR